MAWTHKHVLV
ncbi:hypothetical protein AMELA_G00269780 [Ameiurus melas]|uniref:Uncharacterized protein n=1 Tax=Ameiurus melas TaxID=219545 RepID=A0A7J5ZMZ6_AMEME|nr:hypothetical protein AMELA_G00269780 [Ameiurus melas]